MLNVLIPVDGSKTSLQAIEQAIRLRGFHHEPLKVNLANIQPALPRHITRFARGEDVRSFQQERAALAMKSAVEMLDRAGVEYSTHVAKGDAAEGIVALAHESGAQKILMGTTRKNALARFFQGSVVNKVMALSDLPVEVIAKENATKLERFGIPLGLGLTFLWLAVE